VFTSGRNLRTILAAQQRFNQTSIPTASDRRRRQSWHEINEYYSVPYFQYTNSVQTGVQELIQCDIDNEQLISKSEILSGVKEERVDEDKIKDYVQQTMHHLTVPKDRVQIQISITTQTE
jgi:hypothetical protein